MNKDEYLEIVNNNLSTLLIYGNELDENVICSIEFGDTGEVPIQPDDWTFSYTDKKDDYPYEIGVSGGYNTIKTSLIFVNNHDEKINKINKFLETADKTKEYEVDEILKILLL